MQILLILFAVTFGLSMWGRKKYRRIYESEQENILASGITGAELARRIIESKGVTDVEIVKGRGLLPDHYDPAKRRLYLSPQHYGGSSYSGLGIAAHEAGHVLQHIDGHRPLLWRISAIKFTSYLSLPMLVGGVALMVVPGMKSIGILLLSIGWPLMALTNLGTVAIEMDASERSKKRIKQLKVFRNLDEKVGVERVMDSASGYYVDGIYTAGSWLRSFIPNLLK